jgi:hypothetical protein
MLETRRLQITGQRRNNPENYVRQVHELLGAGKFPAVALRVLDRAADVRAFKSSQRVPGHYCRDQEASFRA